MNWSTIPQAGRTLYKRRHKLNVSKIVRKTQRQREEKKGRTLIHRKSIEKGKGKENSVFVCLPFEVIRFDSTCPRIHPVPHRPIVSQMIIAACFFLPFFFLHSLYFSLFLPALSSCAPFVPGDLGCAEFVYGLELLWPHCD